MDFSGGRSETVSRKRYWTAAVGLLGIFLILSATSMINKSLTRDEAFHYRYGRNVLAVDPARGQENIRNLHSKMPVSALNVLPSWSIRAVSTGTFPGKFEFDLSDVIKGRFVTVAFSLILGLFVLLWSTRLYGSRAGILSLFLYTFSPNILAHSRWVTNDIYFALGALAALYFYRSFLDRPTLRKCVVSSFWLGLAILTKYTGLLLIPLFVLIALARIAGSRDSAAGPGRSRFIAGLLRYFSVFIVVVLLLVNAGFFFSGTMTRLGDYSGFKDKAVGGLTGKSPYRDIIVPLPVPFVRGLEAVSFTEKSGFYAGNLYLRGRRIVRDFPEPRQGKFYGYFMTCLALKVPLAGILLFALALLRYFLGGMRARFFRDEIFLLVPVVFFLAYFDVFFHVTKGLRYVLFILPLCHVFTGSLMDGWDGRPLWVKRMAGILLIYYAVSTLSYYPHFLSYFNEIVFDRKTAYKYLADHNIDWGQNKSFLRRYLAENPEVIADPAGPVPGRILIAVNKAAGVNSLDRYAWLRDNFEPVDHVAYSYLVFDVSREDLEALGLSYGEASGTVTDRGPERKE